MTELHYPEINEKQLIQIAKLYESNQNYFNSPQCPYSEGIKQIFQGTAKYNDFDTHTSNDIPSTDSLIGQVNQLMNELKNYGKYIKDNEDTSSSDQNTYFRLSVTLLEKLLDIKEKIVNIKNYELFIFEVLEIMDKVCNADQRLEVMERLTRFIQETKGANNEPDSNISNTSGAI